MTTLRNRSWKVTVDDIQFTDGLDISFEVEKTLGAEPNKCTLRIWNLSPSQRQRLDQLSTTRRGQAGRIRVELEAGYRDRSLIFRGDLRTGFSTMQGADWLTTLEGEDGGRAVRWSRVSRSFPPRTRLDVVVRACAEAMGVGTGNLDSALAGVSLEFPAGTVLDGPAPDELAGVLRSAGLAYSVQDGALQILRRGRALQSTAVRLAPDTGLVGMPQKQADGTMKFQTLLIPELGPGRQVQLDTPTVRGLYRVTRAKFTGDTSAASWYTECQGVDLHPAT